MELSYDLPKIVSLLAAHSRSDLAQHVGVLPEELSSIWQVGTLYASSLLELLRGFTSGR